MPLAPPEPGRDSGGDSRPPLVSLPMPSSGTGEDHRWLATPSSACGRCGMADAPQADEICSSDDSYHRMAVNMTTLTSYRKQLQQAVDALPEEYLPYVLQIVQTFRERDMLKPAAERLKQGWHEVRMSDVTAIDFLWDDIEAE